MKRRLFPLALVTLPALLAYACSSSSGTPGPAPNPTPEGSTSDTFVPDMDGNTVTDSNKGDTSVGPTGNPIEGIAAPTVIAALNGIAAVGPQWHGDGLYYSTLVKDGKLIKLIPPGTQIGGTTEIRGPATPGNELLGTTYDEHAAGFVTCEVAAAAVLGDGAHGGDIVRSTGIANAAGTPIVLTTDAGTPPAFDSPKNVVARHSDGMLYITDPGYQTDPSSLVPNNHIWRIKITTGEVFETIASNSDPLVGVLYGRPNGLAFSLDQKTLYVAFTGDGTATTPAIIKKYPVATDGSLGAGAAFGTIAADSLADGLVVDVNGNVYVGIKTGVDVFKADGTKWGHITTTKPVNGMAFGAADKKTLFMTNDTGMMQVTVKVAGILE